MDNQTDHHLAEKYLVEKVLSGDNKAFGLILKNTHVLVGQIVYKMIANTEDRKDLTQDIYLKAFHKLSSFRFQARLSTWIAQIAYNTCLSYLEKKKLVLSGKLGEEQTNEESLDELATGLMRQEERYTDVPIFQKELTNILAVEIETLPIIYKTLLVLFHQEDMSYEEMTQITGLPQGTVKSYLFRARKALKDKLLSKYKIEDL